jgi:hypothetical protein
VTKPTSPLMGCILVGVGLGSAVTARVPAGGRAGCIDSSTSSASAKFLQALYWLALKGGSSEP